jgi:hypothetical protein
MAVRLADLITGRALLLRNIFFCIWYYRYRLSKRQVLVRLEGLSALKKYIHLISSRTLDLPACSIVPQLLRYRVLKPECVPIPSLLSVTQWNDNS